MPKISALPAITTLSDDDVLPIVDDSTGSTKKVSIKDLRTLMIPIGSMEDFAGSTAPDGWLLCYGQAVSRSTYADLFGVIGTTFGTGDGSTTFNLPDARGRVIAGKDDMGGSSADRLTDQSGGVNGDVLGAAGGAETHTLTTSQMPQHNHSLTVNLMGTDKTGSAYGSGGFQMGTGARNSGNAGSGTAHNNVQPTLIATKIIRY